MTQQTKPFSIRLSFEERAQLERAAGSRPLGEYVRLKLFGADGARSSRSYRPKASQKELAQILARLGLSELGPSLRELASAARLGALPESPETVEAIERACGSVEALRADLVRALGLRSGSS
ncbi:MAG: hypothetical protein AAFX04_13095 [Pseudomonadota bacterium]